MCVQIFQYYVSILNYNCECATHFSERAVCACKLFLLCFCSVVVVVFLNRRGRVVFLINYIRDIRFRTLYCVPRLHSARLAM